HAAVVLARRLIQAELFLEPRIVGTKNAAEPFERRSHRSRIQPVSERDGIEAHGNRLHDFKRYGARFQYGVAAEQSDADPTFDEHAIRKGIIAVVRDAAYGSYVVPLIPKAGLGRVHFRLKEEVLRQVFAGRQTVLLDVRLACHGNKMQAAKPRGSDVRSVHGRKTNHQIGLILPQTDDIQSTFKMALDLRVLRKEVPQIRCNKEGIQSVGDADPNDALGVLPLGSQIVGEGKKRVVQFRQLAGKLLSLRGQRYALLGGNKELRPHQVLQPFHLPADRRLTGMQKLRRPIE